MAPARDLYASPLFRKSRAWVEANCERWFVLSALHGLVHPDEVIEPYDHTLPTNEAAWGHRVLAQLMALGLAGEQLAGERYVRPLRGLIELREILKGKQIGERLAFLI